MSITISNKTLKATINTKGAELTSLIKNDREYIWEGNPDFWGKHSPILFPIVGTLKDNSYTYNDQKFELSRHGFARDHEFEIVESSENSVTFLLNSSVATLEKYPFEFELRVLYTLEENQLKITYDIKNASASKMPFSIGGHPAFALPENFESYSLLFEKQEVLKSYELENDLVSEKVNVIELHKNELALKYETFEKDALIFKNMESKSIEILENKKPLLRFSFAAFPNFGIWTKTDAPFICLEPWLGYSDTFQSNGNLFDKEGILVLESNENKKASFYIEIL